MQANESAGILYIIAIFVLFAVSFLAGDIAGIIIEHESARKWRTLAEKIGFQFDGRKRRSTRLSEIFLPKLLYLDAEENAFTFGRILKSISAEVHGFKLSINDFSVWDYHIRGPLIYRAVLCVVEGKEPGFPGPISVVKIGSAIFYGISADQTMREYKLNGDTDFYRMYALFGRKGSLPWVFTPELRQLCLKNSRNIDCILVDKREMIVIWAGKDPQRFPELIDVSVEIAEQLLESVPQIDNSR